MTRELRNSEDLTIEEKDFMKKFRTLNECTRKSIIEIVNKFYSLDENYTAQSERLGCSICPGLPAQSYRIGCLIRCEIIR